MLPLMRPYPCPPLSLPRPLPLPLSFPWRVKIVVYRAVLTVHAATICALVVVGYVVRWLTVPVSVVTVPLSAVIAVATSVISSDSLS